MRTFFLLLLGLLAGCVTTHKSGDAAHLLHSDDFRRGLANWSVELEKGGRVDARDGRMNIDVPGGCTVWFRPRLDGPVAIEYDATVISAGGPDDRVSDLNCFWMATDTRSPEDIFARRRSGAFADYNRLETYYVGLGGNGNTTTRFRRYIGDPVVRPLLPEHDLSARQFLLTPNLRQHVRLVADGPAIEYWRDGRRIFSYHDPAPYTGGWFAIRTTRNHMEIDHFRVYRLPAH